MTFLIKFLVFQSVLSMYGEGSLSTDSVDTGIAFDRGEEVAYIVRHNGKLGQRNNPPAKIYRYTKENDNWIAKGFSSFSDKDSQWSDTDIFISRDEQTAFFVSNRFYEGKPGETDPDIFTVKKNDNKEWGIPKPLLAVNSSGYESSPVSDANGNLYFISMNEGGFGLGDIYTSKLDDKGKYQQPVLIPGEVNSEFGEWNLIISPHADWMIFESSGRPEGLSPYGDLYLSKKNEKGNWIKPIHLSEINSKGSDLNPRILYKSKKLVFASSKTFDSQQTDFYVLDLEKLGYSLSID